MTCRSRSLQYPSKILEHLVPGHERGSVDPGMNPQLFHHVLDMSPDRVWRQDQRLGDLGGTTPMREMAEDLPLPATEPTDPAHRLFLLLPAIQQSIHKRPEHLSLDL